MKEKYLAVAALTTTAFLGGAVTPVLVRLGVSHLHVIVFTFFRMLATALAITPFFWPKRREVLQKTGLFHLLVLGGTISINFLFFSMGISHTTIVASQLVYALLPVTVPLLAYIWIKEKLNSKKIFGSAVAIFGVAILVLFSRSSANTLALGTFYGNGVILIAMSGYTVYLVLSKKIVQGYSPVAMSFLTYCGATLFFFPLMLYVILQDPTQLKMPLTSLLPILGMAISSNLFTVFFQYGLKRVSSTTASITTLLSPEFAALSGILLYGEKLSLILLVSMFLVVLGVFLSASGERQNFVSAVREKYQAFLSRIFDVA